MLEKTESCPPDEGSDDDHKPASGVWFPIEDQYEHERDCYEAEADDGTDPVLTEEEVKREKYEDCV